ncbi:CGNR zinc finger domain-containing protein [Streptomyces sp. MAR4 CNX-425]|uniref:CGNR zinc finger domain-containing protein n=1 Tax=Streptomyces sp. MAR4 CNX-425 TaxID=3406343 RepID=UPI003B50A49B
MATPDRSPHAPGKLEFVRTFINTRDIDQGTDQLRDADAWAEWAKSQHLTGPASADTLQRAVRLREALRRGLLANHDRAPLPPETAAALTEAAGWSGVTVAFSPDGLNLTSPYDGLRGAAGRVVGAVADALRDETWSRLKACAADDCHWAFYDHSRSRTGRWCSMGLCGNRNKQSRWRRRS